MIIPCYNYGRYLRACVNSVLSQLGVSVRVLVIDDASSDDSAQVGEALAASESRVEFRRHKVNKGHIATYNEGIESASADYMLVLSADDYLRPNALTRSAQLMDAHPEVGFCFGNAVELDDDGDARQTNIGIDEARCCIVSGLKFMEMSESRNIVPTPTAVVRTELQKRVGGYRVELPHTGDMEMWLRLAAYGSVGIIGAYQAVYRRHSTNMSLAYLRTECSLPDLEQRKAAIECFFQACSSDVPNARQLQRRLIWSLSRDAISRASTAYNKGNTAVCQRLSDFARQVCPEIQRSLPWATLVCKQRMPYVLWCALQPVLARIRHGALSMKRLLGSGHDYPLSS